jgi:hypothetical protein
MELFFEFNPVRSLCGVPLSDITPSTVSKHFGEPDEIDKGENNAYGEASFTYHFYSLELSLFFNVQQLLCAAIANSSFKMFGENVFQMKEDELIYLFKMNGFEDHELDKDWGEKQLIFDKAGVTIFFDNQKVSEIFIDA